MKSSFQFKFAKATVKKRWQRHRFNKGKVTRTSWSPFIFSAFILLYPSDLTILCLFPSYLGLCLHQELFWHRSSRFLDWCAKNLQVYRLLQTLVLHFQRAHSVQLPYPLTVLCTCGKATLKTPTASAILRGIVTTFTKERCAWDFGLVIVEMDHLVTPTRAGFLCPGSSLKTFLRLRPKCQGKTFLSVLKNF